jgi:hypothetical protein
MFKQKEQTYRTSALCVHFLALLLALFYFSAYKFYNIENCKIYSEIVYHAEKDFRSVKILLWELFKCFIIEYPLQTKHEKITTGINTRLQRNPQCCRG